LKGRSSRVLPSTAAPEVKGTAAPTIVAAIASDVAAEKIFFICNNSFLEVLKTFINL
jgi:hypothetical protein